MKRLEELALKELDGELSRSEARELENLLKADSEARECYHQLREVEVMLRNLDEGFDVSESVMAQVDQLAYPKRRRNVIKENLIDHWLPFALPAGVLAGLVLAFVLTRDDPFSRNKTVELKGQIQISQSGGTIKSNERIVAENDDASLHYEDQTQVFLSKGTEVIFDPEIDFEEKTSKRLELLAGHLEAEVTKQQTAPFVLKTPHAIAIVRGTKFELSADKTETRLAVSQGRVELRRASDGSSVAVNAGMYAVTSGAGKLVARHSRVMPDLLAYYTFEEGAGNRVLDRSGFDKPLDLIAKGPNAGTGRWPSSGGFSFSKRAHLESESADRKIRIACQKTRAITIEAWIQPGKVQQTGPARIVTLSKGSGTVNFMLGQNEQAYQLRLQTPSFAGFEKKGGRILANNVSTQLSHVVFTRNSGGDWKFHVDGKIQSQGNLAGDFSNWKEGLRLGLGDDPNGENRFWEGTYRLVAIYSRALSDSEVKRNYEAGPDHSSGGTR